MTDQPRISVVVPCFNAAPYIGATLRSVFAQPGFELDVIVVDDGSTDGSAGVVAAQYPAVTLLRQPNLGAAAARNAGIAHARHDWLAFADADDIWLAGKLRAQWALLASAPAARMVYSDLQLWFSTEPEPSPDFLAHIEKLARDPSRWPGPSGWIYPQLLLCSEVATPTVLIHRSVLDEVGTFDTSLPAGEDYDLWLRASRVTPILRVNAPTVLYRIHGSNTTGRAPARNYRELVIRRALQRWGYRSPDGSAASESGVRRHLARSWVDFGTAHLAAGSMRGALRGSINALAAAPTHLVAWKFGMKVLLRSLTGRWKARELT
jgi:glycosyltransferase involved in cell wall biosynthesis